MKKTLSILLTLVMLFGLMACGEDNTPETTAPQDSTNTVPSTEQTLPEETEVVDTLHEHSYTATVTAPTCTEDGYTTYTCTCGESYVSDKVTAAGHALGEWVTTLAPTEEATGTAQRKCANCDAAETKTLGKLLPNHTHSYTTKVTAEASCTKEGAKTLTCICGESYSEKIAKQPHSYKDTVVSPDCVNGGHTSHSCAVCGDAYVDTYTTALGHNYTEKVTPATCISTGQKKSTCSRCGSSHTERIPKGDHSYAAATCTQAKHCTVCGKVDGTVLGHSYSGGSCTRCGAEDPSQQSGPVSFTVNVRSDKGVLLSGVTVKVYAGETLVGSGITDNKGVAKLNLSASGSSYKVVLSNIPEGYTAKESYTFSATTVNINLTTIPVLDPNDHSRAMYEVGSTMANFVLTDTDGNTYDLSQLRQENKLIILDFWYVACTWCREEFPIFEETVKEYSDDVIFLAVNPYDSMDKIREAREEDGVTFPMVPDTLNLHKGFDISAYPTTVFIDSEGKIVSIHSGVFDDKAEFVREIEKYLR
nr:redoxin domain-containing protein [Oscillospiraceae bacterium]